jgi:hypothetical protein
MVCNVSRWTAGCCAWLGTLRGIRSYVVREVRICRQRCFFHGIEGRCGWERVLVGGGVMVTGSVTGGEERGGLEWGGQRECVGASSW